jgi:hypothetical protein
MNFTAHSRSETSRPRLGFSERHVSLTTTIRSRRTRCAPTPQTQKLRGKSTV